MIRAALVTDEGPVTRRNRVWKVLAGTADMFAGTIENQTIIADQPVLVVDGEAVLNSFSRIQEARIYLRKANSDTAIIFRHNGLNWDVIRQDDAVLT
jgi:hypothetical protein